MFITQQQMQKDFTDLVQLHLAVGRTIAFENASYSDHQHVLRLEKENEDPVYIRITRPKRIDLSDFFGIEKIELIVSDEFFNKNEETYTETVVNTYYMVGYDLIVKDLEFAKEVYKKRNDRFRAKSLNEKRYLDTSKVSTELSKSIRKRYGMSNTSRKKMKIRRTQYGYYISNTDSGNGFSVRFPK